MSNEILQTGLALCKSAVEADNSKNYALASNLYEQAVLNLKLAIVSERDVNKTSAINSKIEEYVQRNKYIKNLINQQPLSSPNTGSTNNTAFNFPSVPSMVSPSIANTNNNGMNNSGSSSFPQFPNVSNQPISNNPSFPTPPNLSNNIGFNNVSNSQDSISKLHSLNTVSNIDSNRDVNTKLNRVEAYEIAKNFSKKGIREEELKNYRGATNYYEQSCSHFLVAIKNEPDPSMKKSMQEEAKIFLDRIETLKPYVQFQNSTQPLNTNNLVPNNNMNGMNNMNGSGGFPSINNNMMSNNNMNNMNGSGGFPSINNMPNNMMGFPNTMNSNNSFNSFNQQQQQQQLNGNNKNNIGMIPVNNFAVDKCAACGLVLSTNSIKALDRNWHPDCFSVSIICAGCQKPFHLVNLSLKVKDGKAYHPMCFESTTGLYQEENKSFVGTSKTLFFSIQLLRKFYKAGETIQFSFIIDNATSKKVDKVIAYLLMSENRMEIIGSTYERRSKKSVKKLGRCEFSQTSRFPLIKDRFEGDFYFSLPPNLLPSETSGVDASFVREYQLVVKCVGPPLKTMTIKLRFNLTLLDQ